MSKNGLQREILRSTVVESVLKNLGDGSFEIIEQYLTNVYGLTAKEASKSPYLFEQLMDALTNLLGQKSAEIIFENIVLELDQSFEMLALISNMKFQWDAILNRRKGKASC